MEMSCAALLLAEADLHALRLFMYWSSSVGAEAAMKERALFMAYLQAILL